jgi:hypothetical protein
MKNFYLFFFLIIHTSLLSQTDQVIDYYTLLGGNGIDTGEKLRFDESSQVVHFAATSSSSDFPLESVPFQTNYGGGDSDAIFGQFDLEGDLVYASFFGGSGADGVSGIELSASGSLFLGGTTESTDFPLENAHLSSLGGFNAGWLARFDESLNLLWSTYVGGGTFAGINDIAVNADDEVFVMGFTSDMSAGTPDVYQSESLNEFNAGFIAKYDSEGTPIWWSYISDPDNQIFTEELALSTDGQSVYVIGSTEGRLEFETSSHQSENGGEFAGQDAVVYAFNTNDGSLDWGSYYGGELWEWGSDVAIASDGTIVVAGSTRSVEGIATPNSEIPDFLGNSFFSGDGFIAALSPSGERLWGTYLGNPDSNDVFLPQISVLEDEIYFQYSTRSLDMPIVGDNPLVPFISDVPSIGELGYLGKFTIAGDLLWSTYSNPDYLCSSCQIVEPGLDGRFYCLGSLPEESDNSDCLLELSENAYQNEYGGGMTDLTFYIYQDNYFLSTAQLDVEPLTLYPNPAQDYVVIEWPVSTSERVHLQVTDLSGRLVFEKVGFESGTVLNTSRYDSGVYLISAFTANRVFQSKLILSR